MKQVVRIVNEASTEALRKIRISIGGRRVITSPVQQLCRISLAASKLLVGAGTTYLGQLLNVGEWADETATVDRVMYQPAGSPMWSWIALSEIVGLDTEALADYLAKNEYATRPWVEKLGYATMAQLDDHAGDKTIHITSEERVKWDAAASDLSAILGSNSDGVINKWNEIVSFLDTYTEADTLASLLSNKADKTTTIKAGDGLRGGGPLSGDVLLSLAKIGTPGTYAKVKVDEYGRVVGGEAGDINDLFEKVNIGTEASPQWAIRAKLGFFSDYFVSSKGAPDDEGEGSGGVSTLGQLVNVDDGADASATYDRVFVRPAGATHWTTKSLSDIVGLDTEALAEYLTTNKYATQQWVQNQGYLTSHQSLAEYATREWVQNLGYIKADALNAYATIELLNKKLDADIFNDFFEKVNIGTDEAPKWMVKAKYGFSSDQFVASKGAPGGGETSGGASSLGQLVNVDEGADASATYDRVLVRLAGAMHWTTKRLADIAGLDTEALAEYLTANKYATQAWAKENFLKTVRVSGDQLAVVLGDGTTSQILPPRAVRADGVRDTVLRRGSANVNFSNDGQLRHFLSSGSMTEGRPSMGDGHIIHMEWDNSLSWAGQLFLPNASSASMQWRTQPGSTWGAWRTLLDEANYAATLDGRYMSFAVEAGRDYVNASLSAAVGKKAHEGFIEFWDSAAGGWFNFKLGWMEAFERIKAPYYLAGTTTHCTNLNADLLDGLHAASFARCDQWQQVDLNTVNGFGFMMNKTSADATPERHYPIQEAGLLIYGTAAYSSANQIYGSYSSNRWFARGAGWSTTSKTSWREFAFLDSNVASATKLATARTLWGQSFDGSGNVSGDMTGVGSISFANSASAANIDTYGNFKIGASGVRWTVKNSNNICGLCVLNSNGHVGINTEFPSEMLHVAGNILVSGDMTGVGKITTTTLAIATTYDNTWSDGTNSHPWYGYDHRYHNTGVYSTTISDFYGLTLRTSQGNISMNATGNVGIGIPNPLQKLHVDGNVLVSGEAYYRTEGRAGTSWNNGYGALSVGIMNNSSQTPLLVAYRYGDLNWTTPHANRLFAMELLNSGSVLRFGFGGAAKFYFEEDGTFHTEKGLWAAQYVSSKGASASSDIRLKYGLEPLTLTLEQIARAPAARYRWRDTDEVDLGSTAQYWLRILPEGVRIQPNGFYGMAYDKIALVASIMLARKSLDHERRIETLERENRELKRKLNQLAA